MALTKTPICDFGKKAENFELNSTNNKKISLNKSSEKSWGVDPQNSEKDFGKLFHLALSKVKYKEDIDKICLDLYWLG